MQATVQPLNFHEIIASDGDELTTTSHQVAHVFGKRHDLVLRDIRNLRDQLPDDRLRNFAETVERRPNPSGGSAIPSPAFRITRDGFTLLAMGFTGKKALLFKLAFIDAFNDMAAHIKRQREGLQYRFLVKECEYNGRATKVSAAAREMRYWRDEKPARLGEMNSLLKEMNIPLFLPEHFHKNQCIASASLANAAGAAPQ